MLDVVTRGEGREGGPSSRKGSRSSKPDRFLKAVTEEGGGTQRCRPRGIPPMLRTYLYTATPLDISTHLKEIATSPVRPSPPPPPPCHYQHSRMLSSPPTTSSRSHRPGKANRDGRPFLRPFTRRSYVRLTHSLGVYTKRGYYCCFQHCLVPLGLFLKAARRGGQPAHLNKASAFTLRPSLLHGV